MRVLIEQLPFPWSRPEVVELRQKLCAAYPTVPKANAIVASVGLDAAHIVWSGSIFQVWTSILDTAASAGKATALLDGVLGDALVAAIHEDVRRIKAVPSDIALAPPVEAMSKGEALAGLEAFLLNAFGMDELRRLTRWELPELDQQVQWAAPAGKVAQEFVVTVMQLGAFSKLFPLIDAARPRRVGELVRIRRTLLAL